MKKVGCYKIFNSIDEGSFGIVKLAEHVTLKTKVAMKTIKKSTLVTKDMELAVKREIKIAKELNHPYIIKIFDYFETDNKIHIVMEYANKGSLSDKLIDGPIGTQEARLIFSQLIFALEYLHRNKICHRDLKPDNILFDEYCTKLSDFGLSNIMLDGVFLYTSCGTHNYASPEVLTGKMYSGEKSDIWSLGVILYLMLSGELPFDTDSIEELVSMVKAGRYIIPNSIPSCARDLISRMLQVDPALRITLQEIKAHKWFSGSTDSKSLLKHHKLLYQTKNETLIDEEIVNLMFSNKYTPQPMSMQEIRTDLHSKENLSLIVIYTILKWKKFLLEWWTQPQQKKKTFLSKISIEKEKKEKFSLLKEKFKNSLNKASLSNCSKNLNFGFFSMNEPYSILKDLLECLKLFNCSWMYYSSYKLKCQLMFGEASEENQIIFIIHIYRVREDKQEYFIDFQRLRGEAMKFLDFTNSFISSFIRVCPHTLKLRVSS